MFYAPRAMLLIEEKYILGDLPTWVTALGTLVLAAAAIFQDYFRSLVWKPKLELQIQPSPPDFHLTSAVYTYRILGPQGVQEAHGSTPCYYFRLRAKNTGNCEAREVEILAGDLKQNVNGAFTAVARFSPMDLLWSDIRKPSLPILIPELDKLCDLAHVVALRQRRSLGHELPNVPDDKLILVLDLQVEPNSGGHLLGPGFYQLTLAIAAGNAKPSNYLLDITFTGDWYDEPDRMFADGVRFHLHKA
ncbi:MAG: hypothetical protein ACHQT6_04520 [Candidatus Acidiferrales bacterium]